MPKSEKQRESADRYLRESVDTFVVRVTKGKKSEIQAHALKRDGSLNKFVNRAIDNQMKSDTEGAGE